LHYNNQEYQGNVPYLPNTLFLLEVWAMRLCHKGDVSSMDAADSRFSFPATSQDTQLLLRNITLLSPTEKSGLLFGQDILIRGNRIQAIGPSGTLSLDSTSNLTVRDCEGYLVAPGLINAHTHSPENMLKATSPSLPLELWLVPLFAGIEEWTPRLVYLSALLGAVEMLRTGTTAVLDHLWTPDGVAIPYLDAAMQAYYDVGIRASVAPSIEDQDLVQSAALAHGLKFPAHPFVDRFSSWPGIDAQLANLERFFDTWHLADHGRLRCLAAPSGIHWCSSALLEACLALAERYQTGMHLHAVETELQAHVIRKALGQGGIAYLESLGYLRPGTSLAHTIWLETGDLERLARSGTTVVHNPVSNLRLGSGRFPFREARQMGVSVALGSDGSASNDSQNMFEVVKLTGLLHNNPGTDYRQWPDPIGILDAATQGGADALGLPHDLGRIAPGQLADLVLFALKSPAFLPLRDPYLHLVYCETGTSVSMVLVDGKIVVEQGAICSINEEDIRQEIRERCATIWPGFPALRDSVAHTEEVQVTFEALRQLLLRGEKAI
jgi:5-methylthioadenosine/S-adenosylhomocysteine deaminase